MRDLVCYFIRNPDGGRGLVFPSDIENSDYSTVGGLYLVGGDGRVLRKTYRLYAVRGDAVEAYRLRQYRKAKSFLAADVAGIGTFVFHAESLGQPIPYVGSAVEFQGLEATRRLRSWQASALDQACRKHDFYFVGYTPRIGSVPS